MTYVLPLKLTNWKDLPNDQPLASAYIKLFGQEVAFVKIDKTIIEEAIPVLCCSLSLLVHYCFLLRSVSQTILIIRTKFLNNTLPRL